MLRNDTNSRKNQIQIAVLLTYATRLLPEMSNVYDDLTQCALTKLHNYAKRKLVVLYSAIRLLGNGSA